MVEVVPNAPEVLTLGECMALVVPEFGESLAMGRVFRIDAAGGESTVAQYLADLGHRSLWMSRLGADPLGDRVIAAVASAGVDVSYVIRDPGASTGVFFKDPGSSGSHVYYYRRNSAASKLSADDLLTLPIRSARVVHVTGVTPALSASAAGATTAFLGWARTLGVRASFDVNYRAGLWAAAEAAPVLLSLAIKSDIVFVGRDEADTLWHTDNPRSIRRLIGRECELVVKDADIGATAFAAGSEEPIFVASPSVDVVEPVGAGDAFAAGYLASWLRGEPIRSRLAFGHAVAEVALISTSDHADASRLHN